VSSPTIKATISTVPPLLKATIKGASKMVARTIAVGGNQSLANLTDVDLTGVSDGSMLIYDGTSMKFVAKTDIENRNTKIIGGSF
jgi:hypothetical protein